ncbi:hypothetical protein ACFTWH_01210 [Streptomyces sp. NPDC057011]|uniref:hypothetical protein n=1 Tax=unclassified Streptomyces TaxID=2593676 RepID=UPI00363517B1
MPIDPYAALNAMLRAEAARFTPPVRRPDPAEAAESAGSAASTASECEPEKAARPAPADSAA